MCAEEEVLLQHILGLRQEVALLQGLVASRQQNESDVDYGWAAGFDRTLLTLYRTPHAPSSSSPPPTIPDVITRSPTAVMHPNGSVPSQPRTHRTSPSPSPGPMSGKDPACRKRERDEEAPDGVQALCSLFSIVPPASCPIHSDIEALDLQQLGHIEKFDAVVVDPPWDLIKTTEISQVTRGVELGYGVLSDEALKRLKIGAVVDNGFVFLWGINSKWELCFDLIKAWGFEYFTTMQWIKKSRKSGKLAKGHGYYLLHAKECIVVGKRGQPTMRGALESDVLFAPRTMQSAKPDELYELIERLFPNGRFLDIFARLTSLRCGWVSIGNQLDVRHEVDRATQAKQLVDRWMATGRFK
eukprot:GGOE01015094.1.p1 GENE.GGOE01015094.1~~GGOE01015094.1.p1  ORF type:complete len:375 (+),score=106.48 GGOE01015094.1:60-1127(+)